MRCAVRGVTCAPRGTKNEITTMNQTTILRSYDSCDSSQVRDDVRRDFGVSSQADACTAVLIRNAAILGKHVALTRGTGACQILGRVKQN